MVPKNKFRAAFFVLLSLLMNLQCVLQIIKCKLPLLFQNRRNRSIVFIKNVVRILLHGATAPVSNAEFAKKRVHPAAHIRHAAFLTIEAAKGFVEQYRKYAAVKGIR